MMFLRIILFSGLVLHKVIWEVMKDDKKTSPPAKKAQGFNLKSFLKLGKVAFLVFLSIQTLFLNVLPIMEDSAALQVIGLAIYTVGLILALAGRLQLGRNWANIEDYQVLPEQQLVNTGIYKYIRHPIYIGDLLLILGLELALNSWLFLLVIPISYIVYRQTLAEEKILSQAFSGYESYQKQTKMFIPFLV